MARTFPLEAVLRLRKMEEEMKMKEFASFDRVLVREKGNLEMLHGDMFQSRQEMDKRTANEGLSAQEGQLYLSYFSAQSSRIQHQENLVQKIRVEVERKRREMSFAVRRRKIIQNLKDKHIAAEERESRRLELIEIDEIAGMRFAARARGEDASES